ncbi:MAG: type IV secretion protein IcmD [Pseudomonadota bacterium]
MKNKCFKKKLVHQILAGGTQLTMFATTLFYSSFASAGTEATSLGSVASTLTSSFSNLAKLITAGAYMAGIGFAMASMLKFKAHKDNPTQIPIGTPIALLFIGAALIFLPNIFGIAGNTIFGGTGGAGGVYGVTGLAGAP